MPLNVGVKSERRRRPTHGLLGAQLPSSKAGQVDSAADREETRCAQRDRLLWLYHVRCASAHALGRGSSPDAHCSLDESGDTHTGEDGADELTDHVLVAAHTQRLSQKEGHSDGATEARQVMLR